MDFIDNFWHDDLFWAAWKPFETVTIDMDGAKSSQYLSSISLVSVMFFFNAKNNA